MAFRITNAISEEDYAAIIDKLSDRKALSNEDGGHFRVHEDQLDVKILDESELDIPLAHMGERFEGGQIATSDCENYGIRVTVAYESRENSFSVVLEYMKDKVPAVYTARFGRKMIDLTRAGGASYRISCIGTDIYVSTLRERRLGREFLKVDVESVLGLVEWVVNAVYESGKQEIELELTARMRGPRIRNRDQRRRMVERAIKLEKPEMTFSDIGGCEGAKEELLLLGHGLLKPESFKKWGISLPRGILLHGEPGTGKTLLAKAMANLAKASLYCVSVADVMSCYYGESPKLIAKVFETAQKNTPSIILFDEIDSLLQQRSDAHEETVRVVSVFLQKMDGIKAMDNVIVIGTTNRMEDIDEAMLRPGRFDKIIAVQLPDKAARQEIFRLHCKGKRVEDAVDHGLMAEKSDGFSGADIAETIQMSLGRKLGEELSTGNADIGPVDTKDMLESIGEYRKRRDGTLGSEENQMRYA